MKKKTKIEKSIKYYILLSKHERESLIFKNINYFDKRLEISKIFINCFTNLKLVEYYFSISNYSESKKYFIKTINRLIFQDEKSNCSFKIKITTSKDKYSKYLFSYLKKFIINFKPFNLINQPYLHIEKLQNLLNQYQIDEIKEKYKKSKTKEDYEDLKDNNFKSKNRSKKIFEKESINERKNDEKIENPFKHIKEQKIKNTEIIFDDPGKLFDFIIDESNSPENNLKTIFITEIKEILSIMKEILYTPPYSILFGRIIIRKTNTSESASKNEPKYKQEDITEDFYDGFGKDL